MSPHVQDQAELTYAVFYDEPLPKFERLLETYSWLRATRSPMLFGSEASVAQGQAFPKTIPAKELMACSGGLKESQVAFLSRLNEESFHCRSSPTESIRIEEPADM